MTQTKNLLPIIVLTLGLLVSYSFIAQATSEADITFPVAELGGCENKEACRSYCDQPDNYRACFAFAKKHNLLEGPLANKDEQELDRFAQIIQQGGPGGCQSQSSCETYCNDVTHIEECLAFGERHGLLRGNELEEARSVKKALDSGAKLPGGCTNKDSCEAYCEDSSHIEECLAFAEAAGFIPPEELQTARRAMELMKNGETPGGCRSKEQCEAYCQDDNHFEECVEFGIKMGFIPPEEAELIKKVGTFGGPGGCKGERECNAFCEKPENQEECFRFAKEHGFISEDEARNIQEGTGRLKEALTNAPPEVKRCIDSAVGSDVLSKIQSGEASFFAREIGDKVKNCFDQFGPNPESFSGPRPEGEFREQQYQQFQGPGGCQTEAECRAYCETHPQECQAIKPPSGDIQQKMGEICPAMPTVNSCPPDQERYVSYKSEECGIYYACRPIQNQEPLPTTYPVSPEEYCKQYPDRCEQKYQEESTSTTYPTSPEDYCKQYPAKCEQQQYYQAPQYIQPSTTDFQTSPSPEEYCAQYPEKCEQMRPEYESSDTYQLQSHHPTLQEFLLGLLYELVL